MLDPSRNHYELFGLTAHFGIDLAQLDAAYRRLQSDIHPDRFAGGTDTERRRALQASARVNEAYRVLREPVARAEYLLTLHGIDPRDETDTKLPLDFLERQLERREAAADASAAGDAQALGAVRDVVRVEARALEASVGALLDERQAYAEARMPVRELRFLSKVGEDLAELDAALEDAEGT